MRYVILVLAWFLAALAAIPALAWSGFDSESADLVEISSEDIPGVGDTITVKNHDTGTTEECLVLSVKRNSRTIEVLARYGDGRERLFVMEGR